MAVVVVVVVMITMEVMEVVTVAVIELRTGSLMATQALVVAS